MMQGFAAGQKQHSLSKNHVIDMKWEVARTTLKPLLEIHCLQIPGQLQTTKHCPIDR